MVSAKRALVEGRKEAALEACRKAGAAIQRAHGGKENRACDDATWEKVQAQARQAIAAADGLGIARKDAEGALYAGQNAVLQEQIRERDLGPSL